MGLQFIEFRGVVKMVNWKDYVGVQPLQKGAECGIAYIITMNTDSEGNPVGFRALKEAVFEFPFTESEVGVEVEKLIMSFPKETCDGPMQINQLKNMVAVKSRRGVANKNFGPAWFYMADRTNVHIYDVPIVVVPNNHGMYAILKNPNFEKYGFVIDTPNPMTV